MAGPRNSGPESHMIAVVCLCKPKYCRYTNDRNELGHHGIIAWNNCLRDNDSYSCVLHYYIIVHRHVGPTTYGCIYAAYFVFTRYTRHATKEDLTSTAVNRPIFSVFGELTRFYCIGYLQLHLNAGIFHIPAFVKVSKQIQYFTCHV